MKFSPHDGYMGADAPEDRAPLQAEVDKAIKDIAEMPNPLVADTVRNRLLDLISSVNWYATEDREEVGRYAIRIWRAAGFNRESGLFQINDDKVLAYP